MSNTRAIVMLLTGKSAPICRNVLPEEECTCARRPLVSLIERPRAARSLPETAAVNGARTREIVAFLLRKCANGTGLADGGLSRAFRDSSGSATLSGMSASSRARDQPGGRLLALQMALRALEVLIPLGDGRPNGAIYGHPRAYLFVDPIRPRLSFRSTWSARVAGGCTQQTRTRARRWFPTIRGEFARKPRRMAVNLARSVLRGGSCRPGIRPGLRADDLLVTGSSSTSTPFPATGSRSRERLLLGHGWVYAWRSRSTFAILLAGRRPPLVRARPCLDRPLYVLTTASLAAGLWDWLPPARRPAGSRPEGTR